MKIVFLSPSFGKSAAGIYFSVSTIFTSLSRFKEDKFHLLTCLNSQDLPLPASTCFKSISIFKVLGPLSFGFCIGIVKKLLQLNPDIVHSHGLWMYHSIVRFFSFNSLVLVSPHGMLDSWALSRSRLKKSLAFKLYENRNLRTADCLHALNEDEMNSIRHLGYTQPIAVIPNPVNFNLDQIPPPRDYFLDQRLTFLFLGRIDEKKGIDRLIHQWSRFKELPQAKKCDLKIAGTGCKENLTRLENLIKDSSLNVEFLGPVYGKEKDQLYASSDIFILPSYSEGLPMAVLEACAFSLPVLITRQCNLPDIIDSGAGFDITTDDAFLASLKHLASIEKFELNKIGAMSNELLKKKYSQESVATKFHILYQWMLNKKVKPDFVYLYED